MPEFHTHTPPPPRGGDGTRAVDVQGLGGRSVRDLFALFLKNIKKKKS